jgi:SAM-dependent methyltransferase
MSDSSPRIDRLAREADFQDKRVARSLQGERELRDRFYFITEPAKREFDNLQFALEGKRVVVVGCGDGGVTPLARRGVCVEGIDISPLAIEKLNHAIAAEGLGQFASARVMNAEALEYPAGSLDAIACTGVLHHLDTETALRSWSQSLKPDGQVLLFEPLARHPLVALFRLITPSMRTADEHPLRGRDFRIMRQYFMSTERHDYGLLTPLAAAVALVPGLSGLARRIAGTLERLDNHILSAFPFMAAFCWMSVIVLRQPRVQGRA